MKVSKWRVLGVAGAFVLSYAVAANAVQLKVNDNTFADLGFWTRVEFQSLGKRSAVTDYRQNKFDVVDARFSIEGQMNKLVQFYGEIGATTAGGGAVLHEGGINLAFMPEFQVRAGAIRVPFTREQQVESYTAISQTERFYDPQIEFGTQRVLLDEVNAGTVIHGEVQNGMLRYDIGIFNEPNSKKSFNGVTYAARIEFTPTMLGFNPEPKDSTNGWVEDTYFGEKGDILTIGAGYYNEDEYDATFNKEYTVTGLTVDAFAEKKVNDIVVNAATGYVYLSNSHLDSAGKERNSYFWYVKGQALYDQVVGIGKPAVYAVIEGVSAEKAFNITGTDKDGSMFHLGIGANYYIKGNKVRLSTGIDYVSYSDGAKDDLKSFNWEDSVTDFFVRAQFMF